MKSYFEELCEELNKNDSKNDPQNEIQCVREVIEKKTGNNRDDLLKIKAEAEVTDIRSFGTDCVTWIAAILTLIGVVLPVFGTVSEWGETDIFKSAYIVVAVLCGFVLGIFLVKIRKLLNKKSTSNITK